MKFDYDEKSNTIEIKDGMKIIKIGVIFLMFVNIINFTNTLVGLSKTGFKTIDIAFVVVILLSIAIIIFFFLKRSSLEKIPVGEIILLDEGFFFGKTYFYFELTNGKKRYVQRIKKDSDLDEFKKAVFEAGIKMPE